MKRQMFGRVSVLAALVAQLAGCTLDTQTLDLRLIDRSRSPNDALACPPGICRAKSDFESPVFAMAAKIMMERAKAVIRAEPRTELVGSDPNLNQLVFVQRSALLRFPDTIWIQGASLDTGATIIIYSRSNYGYSDLGVNRDRVRIWLARIEHAIGQDQVRGLGKD